MNGPVCIVNSLNKRLVRACDVNLTASKEYCPWKRRMSFESRSACIRMESGGRRCRTPISN